MSEDAFYINHLPLLILAHFPQESLGWPIALMTSLRPIANARVCDLCIGFLPHGGSHYFFDTSSGKAAAVGFDPGSRGLGDYNEVELRSDRTFCSVTCLSKFLTDAVDRLRGPIG